jgi:hypothetical protein
MPLFFRYFIFRRSFLYPLQRGNIEKINRYFAPPAGGGSNSAAG